MSLNVKVKGQGNQGQIEKKRAVPSQHPRGVDGMAGTPSLQIKSRKQHRRDDSIAAEGCLRLHAWAGGLPLGSATHF